MTLHGRSKIKTINLKENEFCCNKASSLHVICGFVKLNVLKKLRTKSTMNILLRNKSVHFEYTDANNL